MALELRARARKLRNRWVNQELKQLEAVRRRLERGEVDVLALGDSSFTTPSPRDTDFRMIPRLIGERLDARVATVAGPGFSGHLFGEMLRVIGTLDQRPKAVVFSFPIRTNTMVHIRRHPRYSYPAMHRALAEMGGSTPRRIRAFGRGHDPTPEEYAAFGRLPVRTRWSGDTTIDGFRSQLKGQGPLPWPVEVERVLFDYFHGEVIEPDDKDLPQLLEFGNRLNEYGVPTVAYWTVPPLAEGERLFPGEFADHVRSNWELVRKSLMSTAEHLTIVEPELEDDDFEDVRNANEHFSFTGRSKIADQVVAELRKS